MVAMSWNIGAMYLNAGNYEDAIEYYEWRRVVESLNDQNGLMTTWFQLGLFQTQGHANADNICKSLSDSAEFG
jgi:hypothetical protein